jgi:predicted ribosomally synthesized peptide with SipW-like signal peptide
LNKGVSATHPSLLRKLLLTLMIIGASGSTIGAGTFASYNASAASSGSFDTGYLVLSNTTSATNTACFSYGTSLGNFSNSNSNSSCDSVFTTDKTNLKPGDTAATVNFTMQNKGDIAASSMKLYRSTCAVSNTATGFHGSGDPCDVLSITIQEKDINGNNVKCWLPVATPTCTQTATTNISDLGTSASPLTVSSGTVAVDDIKYFTVTIQLRSDVTDSLVQGRQAAFSLTWMLEQ